MRVKQQPNPPLVGNADRARESKSQREKGGGQKVVLDRLRLLTHSVS